MLISRYLFEFVNPTFLLFFFIYLFLLLQLGRHVVLFCFAPYDDRSKNTAVSTPDHGFSVLRAGACSTSRARALEAVCKVVSCLRWSWWCNFMSFSNRIAASTGSLACCTKLLLRFSPRFPMCVAVHKCAGRCERLAILAICYEWVVSLTEGSVFPSWGYR